MSCNGIYIRFKAKRNPAITPAIMCDKKGVVFVRFLSSAMRSTVPVVSINCEQDPIEV
jgi:hypothetical protein